MHSYDEIRQWQDRDLYDRNSEKIGTIDDVYLDTDTRRPEWVLVNTGFLGLKSNFVPATEIEQRDGRLVVPYDKSMVKDAPNVDADAELSDEEEIRLYDYYGLDRSHAWSATGYADREPVDRERPTGRQTMARFEEPFGVERVRRPSQTVRLKKYVDVEKKGRAA